MMSTAKYLAAVRDKNSRDGLSKVYKSLLDFDKPDWKDTLEDKWNKALDAHKLFYKTNGRFPHYGELGSWIHLQRSLENSGNLRTDRSRKLDSELPGWRSSLEDAWLQNLEKYKEFYKANGRLPKSNELDYWINEQRTRLKRGKLSKERINILDESLPMWEMSDTDRKWYSCLNEQIAFFRTQNRLPFKHESSWLKNQKDRYRLGKLSEDKVDYLDKHLPAWREGSWDVKWQFSFEQCVNFYTCNGRLPVGKEDNGRWLRLQRDHMRRGTLAEERQSLLDEHLPGWRGK